jgi:hypothetical protein
MQRRKRIKRLLPKLHIGEKKKERCSWNFSKERKEIKVLSIPKKKKGDKGITRAFQRGKMKDGAH